MGFALGKISGERFKCFIKEDLAPRINRTELDNLPFRNMRERQVAEEARLVLLRKQLLTASHGYQIGRVGLNHALRQTSGAGSEDQRHDVVTVGLVVWRISRCG